MQREEPTEEPKEDLKEKIVDDGGPDDEEEDCAEEDGTEGDHRVLGRYGADLTATAFTAGNDIVR